MNTLFIAKGLHSPWATGEVSYARSVLMSLLLSDDDITMVSTIDAHRLSRINHSDMRAFAPILKKVHGKYISVAAKEFAANPVEILRKNGIDQEFDSIHLVFPNLLPNKLRSLTSGTITKYIYVPSPAFLRGITTNLAYRLEMLNNRNIIVSFTSEYSLRSYHFSRGKNVRIVPPAVDTNVFQNHGKKQFDSIIQILNRSNYHEGIENIRDCKYIILYMGWLVYERFPYHIILEAFQRILKEFDNKVLFLIIGRESEKFYNEEGNARSIIQYAKELGISKNIAVVLKELNEEEKVSVLNFADVVFMPLLGKRFNPPIVDPPIIILEAMACERPVISSKVLSIPDLIEDNINGLLLDKIDYTQIYSKLKSALESPNIGKEARNLINNKFSLRSVAQIISGR